VPRENDFGPAIIGEVEEGTASWDAGLRPGDSIMKIDGERLRDAIDCYLLICDEGPHDLLVRRGASTLEVVMETGDKENGLCFLEPVFGEVRTCQNSCMFCFVDQLPPGLRPSLYVKDDDYRLSFLMGNFVTLTNLDDEDVERILDERLSPLYVSLHATDPEVRRRLFGGRGADEALRALILLLDGGIDVHVQLVMLRGVNDGRVLDRTLGDLRDSYRGVASIGVVPVGLSDPEAVGLSTDVVYGRESSQELLEQLSRWRDVFGRAGPFAADELFFKAGLAPPDAAYYDDFPQAENGIGLARLFADGAVALEQPRRGADHLIVTSPAGAWALEASGVDAWGADLLVVENRFFGPQVDVCGLLSGWDVARALRNAGTTKIALIPAVAVESGAFIDGATLDEVRHETGVEVKVVEVDPVLLHAELDGGDC
jgi:putative radical SAM enzyme (TIGR03279 family)